MSSCNTCRYNRWCIESSREYPCIDYEERRKQDGRHKRADSPGTGRALERTPGAAPETEEKGLPAAAGASHEPDPAGDHLPLGGGDLCVAGGANLKGGESSEDGKSEAEKNPA